MPNTSKGQGAHLSGPAEPSRLHRPSDVEDDHGLIGSFARDAARGRRASSAELHLPWTCPVTHSREKFYTVCSDHALLNQAASVYRPPNTNRELVFNKQDDAQLLGTPRPSAEVGAAPSGGALMGPEVDCDLMEVSSGNRAPILAWEIDTTDFNAVLTRKTRAGNDNEDLYIVPVVLEPFLFTDLFDSIARRNVFFSYYVPGNLKKCASKKMKPLERPSRNLQDVSPHASLEEIRQRKVFDLRRW